MSQESQIIEERNDNEVFPEWYIYYGTFGERLLAFLIDFLIVTIVCVIVNAIIGGAIFDTTDNKLIYRYNGRGTLFAILLWWLYSALQESSVNQATIGKRALHLTVTNANRERINFGQATARFFGKYLSAAILFIGYLMILWTEKKQALHDKLANTLVVKN